METNAEAIISMFSLLNSLSQKSKWTGPEITAYHKGLSFAEDYYEWNHLLIQEQLRRMREIDENASRDSERVV